MSASFHYYHTLNRLFHNSIKVILILDKFLLKGTMFGHRVYSNFRGLYVPHHDVEYESITFIPINLLLDKENKDHLQVYLDNFAYKTVSQQMTNYLDGNLFETDK